MATRNEFSVVWITFIGAAFHIASSAVISQYNISASDACQRLSNELDENSIAQVQIGCKAQKILDYFKDREELINYELNISYGADVILNDKERLANKIIMDAKEIEYNIQNPYTYNPSRHIFEVFDKIKQSKLFQIIQKMPKGEPNIYHYVCSLRTPLTIWNFFFVISRWHFACTRYCAMFNGLCCEFDICGKFVATHNQCYQENKGISIFTTAAEPVLWKWH